jgi:predicted nucleic acid-binding protein
VRRVVHVTPIDHDTVTASLKDRRVNDFEDGLEYYAAIRSGCEIIVTEDVSDFYFSAIPVVGASAFLTRYVK